MSRASVLLFVLLVFGIGLGLMLQGGGGRKNAAPPSQQQQQPSSAAPSAVPAPQAEQSSQALPPAKAPLPPASAQPDLAEAASAMQNLSAKSDSPSPSTVAGATPSDAGKSIKVLEEQIEYLQGQVDILRKENSALLDKLAMLTAPAKDKGAMPQQPAQNPNACEPPKPEGEGESPDFVGIGIELVRTRELKDVPIPTISVDRSVVQKHIAKWLATQYAADHGTLQGRALLALGAIPEPVDTVALKAQFLSHQIGAWYAPEDQSLYLASEGEPPVGVKRRENALGLSYAYLFKRFGGKLFPPDAKSLTLDARLAHDCVLAGDASLTRFLHALKHPDTGGGGGVGEDPDDPSRSVPIPNFLRQLELAPFMAGFDFMQALHSIGEWDQVNAAYNRLPTAGAEVLDPQLYLNETPFMPQPIEFGDVKVNGAAPFWQDTLGPLATVIFLRAHVAEPIAADTAPGWANDKLLTYGAGENKARGHAVWQTLWRDSNAADAFFSAMREAQLSRYKGSKPATDAPQGVFKIESGGRTVIMQRTNKGYGVLLVDAADAGFAKAAVERFGR